MGKCQKTFKPLKKHKREGQKKLHKMTIKTLGSGNLAEAVVLPGGEDRDEWLALNTVDFFNEVSLLYGVVADSASERFRNIGEGFPEGFEYRWKDNKLKHPIKCSGPDYVEYVMSWVEGNLQNEAIFPAIDSVPFPPKFMQYVCVIFKRLFRVFAIMYTNHVDDLKELNAVAHLHTCFKHFVFFSSEFDLVPKEEMEALPVPTKQFYVDFCTQRMASAPK